jgi:hypothetical protein
MTTQQKEKPKFTGQFPEYPVLLYNHKTRQAKAAASAEEKDKMASSGFVEDPFPPLDPDTLTQQEVAVLQSLLAKAAKALSKLGYLSEKSEEEPKK